MSAVDYKIVTENNPKVCSQIQRGLEEFNRDFFRKKYANFEIDNFVVYAKGKKGEFLGGICGYIFEGEKAAWCYVDYAWVSEKMRRHGIGTKLFKELERYALSKHCAYIQLFTWKYQAVDFYKKLGFEVVGTIPGWMDGYDAIFFKKNLSQ